MANPAPVAQTFFVDNTCQEFFRLDGVVTLVDAKHIEQHLDEEKPEGTGNESHLQLAFADRVIINKIDLLPDEQDLARVEARVREINEFAPIVRSQQSNVSIDSVLNIRAFNLRSLLVAQPAFLRGPVKTKHDGSVSSVAVDVPGSVVLDELQDWINHLVEVKGEDIYRMKGILSVEGVDQRYVYHAVHMTIQGEYTHAWGAEEERSCKLIFIGKDLDEDGLRASFMECLATPENLQKRTDRLRFKLGERVLCNAGREGWLSGVVVSHFFRAPNFPPGKTVPYSVRLDIDGGIIYAPLDDNRMIRKLVKVSHRTAEQMAMAQPMAEPMAEPFTWGTIDGMDGAQAEDELPGLEDA